MLARGDDPEAVLEALSGALTRKFLHGPTHALNHTQGEDREALLRLVPGLFRHSSHSERWPRSSPAGRAGPLASVASVPRLPPRRRADLPRPSRPSFLSDTHESQHAQQARPTGRATR